MRRRFLGLTQSEAELKAFDVLAVHPWDHFRVVQSKLEAQRKAITRLQAARDKTLERYGYPKPPSSNEAPLGTTDSATGRPPLSSFQH